MTHLFNYREVNLQFFVVNFLRISLTPFTTDAKSSSAISNKYPKNQQSSLFSLNPASEKTDEKPAKFSRNRLITLNENDFINRKEFSSAFILVKKTIGDNRHWRCH